jgi:hypothetical protein
MQMTLYIILSIISVSIIAVAYYFRKGIRSGLKFRAQLQLKSLPLAIKEADEDKDKTGRKNLVSLSAIDGNYKPYQKKVLKQVAAANKNKSNAALTPGRKRWLRLNGKKKRVLDYDKVKEAEKRAVYATN